VYVPASEDTVNNKIKDAIAIEVDKQELPQVCQDAGKLTPQACINHVETTILLNVAATPEELKQAWSAFLPVIKAAFAQGIEVVVLGCTDFQLVVTESNLQSISAAMQIVDSLDSLVVWSAQFMCGPKCTYEQIVAYDKYMMCKRNKDNSPDHCEQLLKASSTKVSYP